MSQANGLKMKKWKRQKCSCSQDRNAGSHCVLSTRISHRLTQGIIALSVMVDINEVVRVESKQPG